MQVHARSVILVRFQQLMVAPNVIHAKQENTPLGLLASYALQVSSATKELHRARSVTVATSLVQVPHHAIPALTDNCSPPAGPAIPMDQMQPVPASGDATETTSSRSSSSSVRTCVPRSCKRCATLHQHKCPLDIRLASPVVNLLVNLVYDLLVSLAASLQVSQAHSLLHSRR